MEWNMTMIKEENVTHKEAINFIFLLFFFIKLIYGQR